MLTIFIDQSVYLIQPGLSIIEACKYAGIKIPRFCYHESLSVVGSCRMCLVQLDEDDKLVLACQTLIEDDFLDIITSDATILKAREEILEFLLLDHPLDCPICDQGGECDLQDQVKMFGLSNTKYYANKYSIDDKNFSPFIKTIMTRCIHCTRCVRFSVELTGIDSFGTLNRGNFTEIGIYSTSIFNSEISGNVIDLCPVGALTAKSYTFETRSWELRINETIDVTDSLGSNLYINYINNQIIRILPKVNKEINDHLISDKVRFCSDAFINNNVLLTLSEINQKKALVESQAVLSKLSKITVAEKDNLILINETLSLEELTVLKRISYIYPKTKIRVLTSSFLEEQPFLFNDRNTLEDLKLIDNTCFIFACNPRVECAILNARLRYIALTKYVLFYNYGSAYDSTLKKFFINFNLNDILCFFEGKGTKLSFLLTQTSSSLIFSNTFYTRGFSYNALKTLCLKINPSLLFFKVPAFSNTYGTSAININVLTQKDLKNVQQIFFVNIIDSDRLRKRFIKGIKNFYAFWLNTHIIQNFIINGFNIPLANPFENTGTYLNLEGRPQIKTQIFSTKNVLLERFFIFYFKNIAKSIDFSYGFINELNANLELFNQNTITVFFSRFFFYSKISKISKYPTKTYVIDEFNSSYFLKFSGNLIKSRKFYETKLLNFL